VGPRLLLSLFAHFIFDDGNTDIIISLLFFSPRCMANAIATVLHATRDFCVCFLCMSASLRFCSSLVVGL